MYVILQIQLLKKVQQHISLFPDSRAPLPTFFLNYLSSNFPVVLFFTVLYEVCQSK